MLQLLALSDPYPMSAAADERLQVSVGARGQGQGGSALRAGEQEREREQLGLKLSCCSINFIQKLAYFFHTSCIIDMKVSRLKQELSDRVIKIQDKQNTIETTKLTLHMLNLLRVGVHWFLQTLQEVVNFRHKTGQS